MAKVARAKPFTVKLWSLIAERVEERITYAFTRHDKYAEVPLTQDQRDALAEHLEREIMDGLSEIIHFP